ncbi:MAG: hexokinase [Spirochaetaceae bacterium]|jgi:hexokinase|nr:hexokinase [Spirochaetaceae bacterium]
MRFDPHAISDFARQHEFHYELCDPFVLIEDFKAEMDRGLNGKASSLAMIPSYLKPLSRLPPNKTVIALDAGGTNFRASRVRFTESGEAAAEGTRKIPMPGTRGRVGALEFFDEMVSTIIPLLDAGPVAGMGFCFSYPAEITEDTDGRLLQFTKEVDAPELVGCLVGKGLREALKRRGVEFGGRIVVLNDTVSTLLAGLVGIPGGGWGQPGPAVGFILGTGINIAYIETSIPKIGFSSVEFPQVAVTESGNFAWRYRGSLDLCFDKTTRNPGVYTLEKASAGAYLGPLSLMVFKQAISDGLLKFRRAGELEALAHLETKDLNAFMKNPLDRENPLGKLFDDDEGDAARTVIYLAWIITERAGLLTASMLSATAEHIAAGPGLTSYDPASPLRIAVEGTTYVAYQGLRRSLESQLHRLLTAKFPRSYSISPVEHASLFGAAAAALSA